MNIDELVERIRTTPSCRLLRSSELPRISAPCVLPADLRAFYELAGGADLYKGTDYPAIIVEPGEVVPANPLIIGEQVDDDISSFWHIIASDGAGEYLTIDLQPDRVGRCYDSFSDRHGVAGSCPIIAQSFTDLLDRLLDNQGQHWYWLRPSFVSLGDAYD